MTSSISRYILFISICLITVTLFAPFTFAHRSGCHRWHSCPSDRGTYVCGDRGNCSQCPDNRNCQGGKPRASTTAPPRSTSPYKSPYKSPATQPGSVNFTGQVVGVLDGDTIEVLLEGRSVRIRLHGIDTPEKGQPFGSRARQFTSNLVFRRMVRVHVQDKDRYGRLIGDIVLDDGRVVNHELVRAGLAWWYRQYAPDDTTFAMLEAEAKAARLGLWNDPHAVAPWEWRKQK